MNPDNGERPEEEETPQPEQKLPTETEKLSSHGEDAEREMHKKSRRSFLEGAAAAAIAFGGWKWLTTRSQENGILWPLRLVLEINEHFWRDYFKPSRLAPAFPVSRADEPRVNGEEGLSDDFDPTTWSLRLEGGTESPMKLMLSEIKALPRVELVTELKCIEGWSTIVHWAGARFRDFAAKYPPVTKSGQSADFIKGLDDLPEYVYMETPDKGYYVGLDLPSALHPQTLLCYEMNGRPLTLSHGAPLRLVVPVKYGIKSIKRIGLIRYTGRRPADYWAEQGYDWFAGL